MTELSAYATHFATMRRSREKRFRPPVRSTVDTKRSETKWERVRGAAPVASAVAAVIVALIIVLSTYSGEQRTIPTVERSYTYSYSADFSGDEDRGRQLLQPSSYKRVLNDETVPVLENQGQGEAILWLLLKNLSPEAHIFNYLEGLNFRLGDIEVSFPRLEINRTLAAGDTAAIPFLACELGDEPDIYLAQNAEFGDMNLSLDQDVNLRLADSPPPLIPSLSQPGLVVMATLFLLLLIRMMRRKISSSA